MMKLADMFIVICVKIVNPSERTKGLNVIMMSISCEGCEVGLCRKQGEQFPVMYEVPVDHRSDSHTALQASRADLSMQGRCSISTDEYFCNIISHIIRVLTEVLQSAIEVSK